MITLKRARELAESITDKNIRIPKPTGLRDWISKDLISSYVKIKEGGRGNGRVGLYDDTLPVQIAVTAKLKKDYILKEIIKARKETIDFLKENNFKNEEDLFKGKGLNEIYKKRGLLKEYNKLMEGKNVMIIDKNNNEKEMSNLFKEMGLIKDYAKTYIKYHNKLKKQEEVQE